MQLINQAEILHAMEGVFTIKKMVFRISVVLVVF